MFQFDATNITPSTGGSLAIPEGEYTVVVDESSIVPIKATPDVMQLRVRFSVIEGEYANKKVYNYYGIYNPDIGKAEAAKSFLAAVCHSTGVLNPQGQALEQLHGIPMRATISLDAATGQYPASNSIKKITKISTSAPGSIPQAQQPITQALPQQPASVAQQVPQAIPLATQQPAATPTTPNAALPPEGAVPLSTKPAWQIPSS